VNIICADANVFLDALLQRGKMGLECLQIIEMAERRELILYISSSNLMNVIFFLQKAGKNNRQILLTLKSLLSFATVISPDNKTIIKALDPDFNDIEDAIQYYTALQVDDIGFFITSNIKDFKKAVDQLPVVTPKQFLNKYK
jgi:predicted nucleic acid-binding protein